MQKTCHYCQESFEATRSHAKYCKPAHRIAYAHAKPLIAPLIARIAELEEELELERSYIKELEASVENSELEYDSEFSFD